MRIRPANPGDAATVASIILTSLPGQSPWHDALPPRCEQSRTYSRVVAAVIEAVIEQGDAWHVVVAEETITHAGLSVTRIVSAAVWQVSSRKGGLLFDLGTTVHSTLAKMQGSVDLTTHDRAAAEDLIDLLDAGDCGRQSALGDVDRCMFLQVLATRPSHQRRGYATALVQWGLEAARRPKVSVGALCGPKGYIMLSGMGFEDCGLVALPTRRKNLEDAVVKVMVTRPKRRASVLGDLKQHLPRMWYP